MPEQGSLRLYYTFTVPWTASSPFTAEALSRQSEPHFTRVCSTELKLLGQCESVCFLMPCVQEIHCIVIKWEELGGAITWRDPGQSHHGEPTGSRVETSHKTESLRPSIQGYTVTLGLATELLCTVMTLEPPV